ncbi:nuclear transport factor 2 family protein [Flammeovirga agarivorans]|uniref:Nuclear transport factor 2 family protein n=1 Tax=Flammeovirga agarivorans TaxID=2726742 RepID=A0A7X8SP11_9BACT|nr:nuclear transport factor 2 family protein [Flammeovirga agarivorans]NLR93765.1 nuclear transport factor 2 family protein [Flammeovirga agarivorans]
MEIENIKHTIEKNYLQGAFNATDINAFRNIFHPEFAIINIQENGHFFLFTRDMWEGVLQERQSDKTFDYATIALQPKWRKIDIEQGKASVTLDLYNGKKRVYTDFLLLTKIDKEWKIVSKIFNQY